MPSNMTADLDFVNQMVEETEDTILMLDGNGALLTGTPFRLLNDLDGHK